MTLSVMEMLFNKKLSTCNRPTEEDINNYKDLLVRTQSTYKNNGNKQSPKGFRSSKYVGLISGLVKKEGGRLAAKRMRSSSPQAMFVRYVEPKPKRLHYYGGPVVSINQEDIDADWKFTVPSVKYTIDEIKQFWRWGSRPRHFKYMRLLIEKLRDFYVIE